MPIHNVKLDVKRSQSASAPEEGSGGLTSLGLRVLRFTSPRVDCAVAVNCDTADCATVAFTRACLYTASACTTVMNPVGMDALVTVWSWNTNGIMVWAWLLWSPYAVRSWNTNGIMVWAWLLWSPYAPGTRTELWFGHGCSGHRMLLEHERNYGSWSRHGWSAKYAMRGGSNDFEAPEGSKVLFVPRRPVPMGSGGNAFFARLRHVGTSNSVTT